jgi:hypothetical protein
VLPPTVAGVALDGIVWQVMQRFITISRFFLCQWGMGSVTLSL